jgi:uncharacterized Zn-finger protein
MLGPGKAYCKKMFFSGHELVEHVRIHTGEMPHQCEICQKSFAGSANLAKHMRAHFGIRPYRCSICEMDFIERWKLDRHCQSQAHKVKEKKERRSKVKADKNTE